MCSRPVSPVARARFPSSLVFGFQNLQLLQTSCRQFAADIGMRADDSQSPPSTHRREESDSLSFVAGNEHGQVGVHSVAQTSGLGDQFVAIVDKEP